MSNVTTPPKVTASYRITITGALIAKIVSLAKTESPLTQESIDVLTKLAPFQAKIEAQSIVPAYISEPKPSVLESLGGLGGLGGSGGLVGSGGISTIPVESVPKEIYWSQCHDKYLSSPEDCSLAELQGAREYRYLNDLMSPSEVADFESGGVTSAASVAMVAEDDAPSLINVPSLK